VSYPSAMKRTLSGPVTLAVDIGGSGIKAMLLDARGRPVSERVRVPTPKVSTVAKVLDAIDVLVAGLPRFDRVSVGFPGVVHDGVVDVAANLGTKRWHGCNLQRELAKRLRKPVRVLNDAAVQGMGVIEGRGVEFVMTLGTGLGTAVYSDGAVVPLEMGHHPWMRGKVYEDLLSDKALERVGKKKWRARVLEAIGTLRAAFNWRRLYIGGGNARLLEGENLGDDVEVVRNVAGLLGGIRLWTGMPVRSSRRASRRPRR
jgi:polyphosphate glucokinase